MSLGKRRDLGQVTVSSMVVLKRAGSPGPLATSVAGEESHCLETMWDSVSPAGNTENQTEKGFLGIQKMIAKLKI